MSLKKYDEILGFQLPNKFQVIKGTNDEGDPTFSIGLEESVDEDGNVNYEHQVNVITYTNDDIDVDATDVGLIKLTGNVQNLIRFEKSSSEFMGMNFDITTAFVLIVHKSNAYLINSILVGGDERFETWVKFLNNILSSVVINNEKADFEYLTKEMINNALAAMGAVADAAMPYPIAHPVDGQHSHFDFLNQTQSGLGLFGGLLQMNISGTEYSFERINADFGERFESDKLEGLEKSSKFTLANTALKMGEIFRVDEDVFDESEDREQEIENGLVRRCSMYEAFRSFAWTLAAYCDKENISPGEINIELLEEIADFVVDDCGSLNYKADSFCPTICSGDDIHNYYISDSVSASVKNELYKCIKDENGEDNPQNHVLSLDGLREDLEYLFPAMQTIYDALAATRDFSENLEGSIAEVLYVWCSMTYAARYPIFTEDGPMNCGWIHPGEKAVLTPFNKKTAIRNETEPDCGYSFTYDKGLVFKNEHYTFAIPDNFKILEGEEDRDFIAYLPLESDPENYLDSDFIIFAGQDLSGGINAQLKLPEAYCAVLSVFSQQFPDSEMWYYERRGLPGLIAVNIESRVVHANAVVAYGETLKMMRFQIATTSKKKGAASEKLIKEMLDRMEPINPVDILDEIDADEYINMGLSSKEVSKWTKLINSYSEQLVFARNKHQEQLVTAFQNNNPGIQKLKKQIKDMLGYYVQHAATYLKKADAIYQLKRAQFPNNKSLDAMKKPIEDTFLELASQFVNLDDEKIEVVDEYVSTYKKHQKTTPINAIKNILSLNDNALNQDIKNALKEFSI